MAKKSASAAQAYLRSKSGAAKKKQSGGKKSSGNKGLAQAYARHKSQEHGERVKGDASSNGDTNRKQRGDSSPRFASRPKGRASGARNMERTSRAGNAASNRASTTRNRAEARTMTQSERRARLDAIMQKRPPAREAQHSGSGYGIQRKAENTATRAMTPSRIRKMERKSKKK